MQTSSVTEPTSVEIVHRHTRWRSRDTAVLQFREEFFHRRVAVRWKARVQGLREFAGCRGEASVPSLVP